MVTWTHPNCAPICHTNYGHESVDLILFLIYGHDAHPIYAPICHTNYGHKSFELILFLIYGHMDASYLRANLPHHS